MAILLETTALVMSGVGVGLEFGGSVGGTAIEPGLGTVGGFGVGLVAYQPLNAVENVLGAGAAILTVLADNQLGKTYFDSEHREASIGQDSIAAAIGAGVGFWSGEAVSDSIINGASLGYSLGRMADAIPEQPPFHVSW